MSLALPIATAVVATAAIAAVVVYGLWNGKRRRAAWEAEFLPLDDGLLDAVYTLVPGDWQRTVGRAVEIQRAVRIAVEELAKAGVWTTAQVVESLHGLHIAVMPTVAWVDNYGRKVAGLTYVGQNCVDIGADYAALVHEMVEMMLLRRGAAGVRGTNQGGDNWWIDDERLAAASRRYWERIRTS